MVKFVTKVSYVQMRHDFDTSKLLISLAMPVREYDNSGVADALGSRSATEAVGSRYFGRPECRL